MMTINDWLGIAVTYTYVGILLLTCEILHHKFQIPQNVTRKIIHVCAGMWVFGILFFFKNWQIGILPFATFIIINYLLYRYRFIRSMDAENSSPGTVYFALSITLLFALLWRPNESIDKAHIATAGVMAMTWGDALAALIGQHFGKHKYKIGNSVRSWEGSAAMFLASAIAIFLVLLILPGSPLGLLAAPLSLNKVILAAFIGGICATLVEGVAPHGTDNLSVPLLTSGVLWLLLG
ncbi:MAG TPA: SEC59/DGK1/VTE5 family protein [Nostocaceae cyanobacterium]|nr:SEC59/DGK1/VTE5 family protein [Nostocaceae cyanobacterium]